MIYHCIHKLRIRPEGAFKNTNRIPDLPKHNSSFKRNAGKFFYISVQFNPKPDFQFLVPVPAKLEIGFFQITEHNLPDYIFSQFVSFKNV